MNYYYLSATLPAVSIDSPPPISLLDFVATCQDQLTKKDMDAIRTLLEPEQKHSEHRTMSKWQEKETLLKNTITKLRASKLKKDAAPFTRETTHSDVYTEMIASDAFSRESPLEREHILDSYRWKMAEELAGSNPFSSDAIIAYAIKLKLSERWASFDDEKAKTAAENVINKNPQDEVDSNSQEKQ